jgi:hypothetical protein
MKDKLLLLTNSLRSHYHSQLQGLKKPSTTMASPYVFSFNNKRTFSTKDHSPQRTNNLKPASVGEITSVKDLIDVLQAIQEGQYALLKVSEEQKIAAKTPINNKMSLWFRGQSNFAWELAPALSRGVTRSVVNDEDSGKTFYLDERSALFHLTSVRPELRQHTLFDVLAIAQHHGLSTRLLDWSQSAITSLLFAVGDSNTQEMDGEFFILNPMKLNFYTIGKYGICRPEHPEVSTRAELAISRDYRDLTVEAAKFSRFYLDNVTKNFNIGEFLRYKYREKTKENKWSEKEFRDFANKSLAQPVAAFPLWKDARLQVQQGVFTIQGGKSYFSGYMNPEHRLPEPKSLFEIQQEARSAQCQTDDSTFLISYKIPAQCKYSIERELRRLGINKGMLFPELESQAKYINFLSSFPPSGTRAKSQLYLFQNAQAKSTIKTEPDIEGNPKVNKPKL